MIIYNVTVQVEAAISQEWQSWMQEHHIPAVMATGKFLSHELFRLMDDREDHHTFAVQYRCSGMDELLSYQEVHAPALQAEHRERYDGRFVAFRSLLERIPTLPAGQSDV